MNDFGVTDVVTIGETMVSLCPLTLELPLERAELFTRSVAGAESNVAIALARLGHRARWISRLGADPFGDLVLKTLRGEGVDVDFVTRDQTAPTGVLFREFTHAEPNAYYYRRYSAASRLSSSDWNPAWLAGARLLHVTGITPALSPGCAALTLDIMRHARAMGIAVSFDPNLRRKLWDEATARATLLEMLALCDVFLPGLEEARFLLGPFEPHELGERLLCFGPLLVALKLGAAGAMGFTSAQTLTLPAHAGRVIDPIGAGDAFDAGLLSGFLDDPALDPLSALEDRLAAALERGNLMGALATRGRGDWEGLPTRAGLARAQRGESGVTR